jgi:Na+/H+ antiporter NhaA
MDPQARTAPLSGRTAWARSLETPLRAFLETETGSAAILLAATIIALIWANVDAHSYQTLWGTQLSIRVGGRGISQDLRHWVNTGLMTLFFFVVGLEARREFDVGDLRERRRVAVPLVAAVGGMLVPIGIYLAANAGRPSEHGWAAAMSTDTAFALGMLALVAPRAPQRLRSFLLTIAVVDDLVAIGIIALVYSEHVEAPALLVALGIFAAILLARPAGVRLGLVYAMLGAAAWLAIVIALVTRGRLWPTSCMRR